MITDIAHMGTDKMYHDIQRILRDLSFLEAKSRITKNEMAWARYHVQKCHKTYKKLNKLNIQRLRAEHTKHK